MKNYLFTFGPLLLICVLLGCNNPCRKVECQNGGSCFEGACQCPDGYTGFQCETNECNLRDCQNGSECVTGTCECLTGYYGLDCEFSYQDIFIGTWEANQNCASTGSGTSSEQYNLLITAGSNEMEINLYLGSSGWVTADIENTNDFTIPLQQQTWGLFNGSGELVNDSTISLEYTRVYGQSQDTENCVVSLVRQ